MVISQLASFDRGVSIASATITMMVLFVGPVGNASGRILSGWLSDAIGRLNTLRVMITISMIAMLILYAIGSSVTPLYVAVLVVYWCYGAQISVNASATPDFWGTKNAGVNYGMLLTAWGVAAIITPQIVGVLFSKYGYSDYNAVSYWAAG
jgi:MFS family permease